MGGPMNTDYSFIVEDLLKWYDKNSRKLPWRDHPDPYYVWVSEIMLQQTRVEAVKGYFKRFTDALPGIKDLAEADPDLLLKLWEGLGYYNRVRNMQKAAQTVMEQYDGKLPSDYKELLSLSGIGTYTAGAISSIAFKQAVPAVDGNVLRVTKRVIGSYDDITQSKVKKQLEEDMLAIMPGERSGDLNQALMDLGATICIPNGQPLCEKCPLNNNCVAYKKGLTSEIPVKPSKKARKIEDKTIIMLRQGSRYALHQRNDKGLLASLWEYPNEDGKLSIDKLEKMLEKLEVKDYSLELLGQAKHVFSHVEWHMIGYRVILEDFNPDIFEDFIWKTSKEILEEYAIPTAFQAYTKQL